MFGLKLAQLFHFHNDTFAILLHLLAVYNGGITKFPYGGDLGASLPQLFGHGGDRPHHPHGVGAYAARRQSPVPVVTGSGVI